MIQLLVSLISLYYHLLISIVVIILLFLYFPFQKRLWSLWCVNPADQKWTNLRSVLELGFRCQDIRQTKFGGLFKKCGSWPALTSESSDRTLTSPFVHFASSAGLSFFGVCFDLCYRLPVNHRAWTAWCCTSFSFQILKGCLLTRRLFCRVWTGCCDSCLFFCGWFDYFLLNL